jgi:hypothetical protein
MPTIMIIDMPRAVDRWRANKLAMVVEIGIKPPRLNRAR